MKTIIGLCIFLVSMVAIVTTGVIVLIAASSPVEGLVSWAPTFMVASMVVTLAFATRGLVDTVCGQRSEK